MKFIAKTLFLILFAFTVLTISYWYKLNQSQQQALLRDIDLAWQDKRLPDNLLRNIMSQPQRLKETLSLEKFEESINKLGAVAGERHSFNCRRTVTEKIQKQTQSTIYSWVDENGRKHFSDQQPTQSHEDISDHFDVDLDYFNLSINDAKAKKIAFANDKIDIDVTQIYKILAEQMPRTQLRKVTLNLRLFEQQDEFQLYKNSIAPGLNTNAGFYTSALNEAVVFQQKNNPERTFAVVRHESSHVIMAGLFGMTPTWFNEGFAEYFERLFVAGQQRKIAVAQEHLHLLREYAQQQRLPLLADFFSYSGEDFYSEETVMRNYAMGWAIVFFLQSNSDGMRLFDAMIKQLSSEPCAMLDMPSLTEGAYPGGMHTFEHDWQQWLLGADISAHYY